MTKLTVEIGGMSCGHCVAAVSRSLKGIDGVEVEQVQVGSAVLQYDESAVSAARITQAIEDEGYPVVGTR
ncbi:MAG TPA: heavy-metal-associated domain-containing protein [Gemmatimonadaceae bacterium]|nr:heavy-metal-associated domain-containing protein [Gemmatimonadaceae bacterium]